MEKWMGGDMHPSYRILMGPGPSNVHYRVYQAMSNPVIALAGQCHLVAGFRTIKFLPA